MENLEKWKADLKSVARPEKVEILSGFFKTGKGGYGEGDIFIGVVVPDNRKIAKRYFTISMLEIETMLASEIHEHRLSALLCLVEKYTKSNDCEKKDIVDFYLSHTAGINNWDLVDLSAPQIIGNYMLTHDHSTLFYLSQSSNMWEQRIAIVSTYTLIKNKMFDTTIALATHYLNHKHDLIHKATGWMLREMGKRDESVLISFLNSYSTSMPRTTLRYAIEKLDPDTRSYYMKKK